MVCGDRREEEIIMGKDVIIACDFDSAEKTFAFLDKFSEEKPFV